MGKKTIVTIFIGVVIGVCALVGFISMQQAPASPVSQPVPTQAATQSNTFSYGGKDGKDALIILNEKTTVEQDDSGLVTSINGRKADASKKEFWAFYVNSSMAQVGPKEYVTKDGDKLEWKIETY